MPVLTPPVALLAPLSLTRYSPPLVAYPILTLLVFTLAWPRRLGCRHIAQPYRARRLSPQSWPSSRPQKRQWRHLFHLAWVEQSGLSLASWRRPCHSFVCPISLSFSTPADPFQRWISLNNLLYETRYFLHGWFQFGWYKRYRAGSQYVW